MKTYQDFAQRVLFASTLEEKLAPPPAGLVDGSAAALTGKIAQPGRPRDLQFAAKGARVTIPSASDLEHPEQRAILLHFFANHELLAAELMALALLRFPDAPPAFRRGLMHTLAEEQEHTRLYMQRMEQENLAFGALPVNGFFWKYVGDMQSPLEYVSRLSLTFEQANLDFSRHYAGLMRTLGDEDTAGILQRIYQDEISHVGYGLRWFRKWKPTGSSDWQAWREVLQSEGKTSLPNLSPVRARGNVAFNNEGRRRAGLDDEFIRELEVFSQSKGRHADLFFFNPGAEECVLHENGDAASAATRALAADLAVLPAVLGHADDAVLVPAVPRAAHLQTWKAAGLPVPEFIQQGTSCKGQKFRALRPWGWSPDSLAMLRPYTALQAAPEWSADWRRLYAKSSVPCFLRNLDPGQDAGIVCRDMASVVRALAMWRERGWSDAVVKAPWSLAGRGLCRTSCIALAPTTAGWVAGQLKTQGELVVEPWFERVMDFSAQYEVPLAGPTRLLGLVRLLNDAAGAFMACEASTNFTRILPPGLAPFFHQQKLQDYYENDVAAALATFLQGTGFRGGLGIDAFVYRDRSGALRLRSVVEINPRCTMGRITWALAAHVRHGLGARLEILHGRHFREGGVETPLDYAEWLRATRPLRTAQHHGQPIITEGSLALNDPAEAKKFLAVFTCFKPEDAAPCLHSMVDSADKMPHD